MIDYKALCLEVTSIAKNSGAWIKEQLGTIRETQIESKGLHDFVTYVDKKSELQLIDQLSIVFPDAGFLAEEGTRATEAKEFQWIIDPLDGTTNFLHGLPIFSVSIALVCQNKPVLGVVYEINRDECFYAWKDGGAYLNGEPIHVTSNKDTTKTLIATGFPYREFAQLDRYLKVLEYYIKNSAGVRRMGSAAVDLVYVACGRFDGFFEYNLNAWDVAAGTLIVQQAGGSVSDFNGNDNPIFGRQIIAASPFMAPDMIQTLQNVFLLP